MRKRWRCFHCDDVFTSARAAAEHFGGTQAASAACQIKGHEHGLLGALRAQEEELAEHRAESGPLLRAMASMRADHAEALRREEERGFGRAVREMQSLAEKQFGQPIAL
jgi:transposase